MAVAANGHVDRISHTEIIGWYFDPERPGAAHDILIISNGEIKGTVKTDGYGNRTKMVAEHPEATNCHFAFKFAKPLPQHETHRLEIRLSIDGTTSLLPNGRITLYGAPSGYEPILVTSTGRSGTTMIMQELARWDDIVVADSYPYEILMISYYAAALHTFTYQPFVQSEHFAFTADSFNDTRIGPNPWNVPSLHRELGGDALADTFATMVPAQLAAAFRNIITQYYGLIASRTKGGKARFFAEKLFLHRDLRQCVRLLFPTRRELVVIRDPRDYLCSAKRFWNLQIDTIVPRLKAESKAFKDIAEREEDALWVRYEDLIRDPEPTWARIGDYVGSSREGNQQDPNQWLERHSTSAKPSESVGRWKQELTSEEVDLCTEAFAWMMEQFRYE